MHEENSEESARVDRRGMLRRAGVVVAGAAGAAVAGAVAATPAQAAAGDPVVQGATNDAGTAETSLKTNSAGGAALALENAGQDAYGDGGPSLRLAPSPATSISDTSPAGSMMLAANGMVMTAPPDGAGGAIHNHYLYDSYNSAFTVPVSAYRAVDSRYAKNDRARLFETAGKFDSEGRLLAGKTVHLDLSDLVSFSWGVFGNVVTFSQLAHGFMVVWPYGQPRPAPMTLEYYKGVGVRNTTLVPVGWNSTRTDVLSIWTSATTHFTIDIVGVVINHWASLSGSPMAAATPAVKTGVSSQDDALARRQAAFAKKIADWSQQAR
jgi:hypothetical protein